MLSPRAIVGFIFFPLVLALAWAGLAADQRVKKSDQPPGPMQGYVPSTDCRECHKEQFDTWHRTFHRTMTQEAAPETVLGDFVRSNTISYLGVTAEMVREGTNFFMKLRDERGRSQSLQIVRTVGSRRMQQYLTADGTRQVRLPVAYDLVNRRWMHLNGSFFYPDGTGFRHHVTEWNSNCIFCHNTKASPGYDWEKKTWESRVAELGIGCGSCHGPGFEHVQAAASPGTRLLWTEHAGSAPPTRIVHPGKIDSDRAMQICGHCHGQRVPQPLDRIREIMTRGDPYDAGEDLHEFFIPIQKGTKVGATSFDSRFWADGSPRLSAFEYQGLLRSKCHSEGKPGSRITCISCHSMHGGDPKGMIRERNRGNAACVACHPKLSATPNLIAHTGHGADSAGSSCYECHMPKITFGVMEAHRTHDISIPRPGDTISMGKPNACNQCHLDKSANWAVRELARLWPKSSAVSVPSSDTAFDQPEAARALAAGDALVRGLTARALGHAATNQAKAQFTGPLLLNAMNDRYPIVRYFAANGLAALDATRPKPDYLAPASVRQTTVGSWTNRFDADALLRAKQLHDLISKGRQESDIQVGE